MVSKRTVVVNRSGLHLRPAADLSKLASSMSSEITIVAGEKRVNPKSVLILMSAAITKGTEIEIICEGENEAEDLKRLVEAIESGLGEGTE